MPKKQDGGAPDTRPICGANKSRNRGICQSRILGPNGRCRAHGGFGGGAPTGNKNALVHGGYETIFGDSLSEDEQALFAVAAGKTQLEHVRDELGLITVREQRLLQRIKSLKDAPGGMTVTEVVIETIEDDEGGPPKISDRWACELDPDDPILERAGGTNELVKAKRKREGTLGQIQAIEAALTAVQAQKAKLIRLKHDLEMAAKTNPLDDADFDGSLFGEDLEDDEDGAGEEGDGLRS